MPRSVTCYNWSFCCSSWLPQRSMNIGIWRLCWVHTSVCSLLATAAKELAPHLGEMTPLLTLGHRIANSDGVKIEELASLLTWGVQSQQPGLTKATTTQTHIKRFEWIHPNIYRIYEVQEHMKRTITTGSPWEGTTSAKPRGALVRVQCWWLSARRQRTWTWATTQYTMNICK